MLNHAVEPHRCLTSLAPSKGEQLANACLSSTTFNPLCRTIGSQTGITVTLLLHFLPFMSECVPCYTQTHANVLS